MKRATTVQEQIAILEKRGMIIDVGYGKAEEILSDIGYFRLGFYCFPFEETYPDKDNRTHKYKSGTKFSDVVALYYLDKDLRKILSDCLNRIEINFRTNIVYTASNQYINCNTWFVDPAVMEQRFIDDFDLKLYNTKEFLRNSVIARHHRNHINDRYAPAWKTLEFFTFGTMVVLYRNLKDIQLKKDIATRYGIRYERILENYFNALTEVRNICAHNAVLFDHRLHGQLRNGPAVTITTTNQSQIFPAIKIVYFILSSISQNRANEMKRNIIALFDTHKNNKSIHWIIENCIGYKNNF